MSRTICKTQAPDKPDKRSQHNAGITQERSSPMAHILLAEDDKSMSDFLTMALAKEGHTVTTCDDGLKALEALKTDAPYDLLLSDIVMPGMDGIELSQKATTMRPDLKVMFITGFAAVAMGEKTSPSPDAKILSKPFHLRDLVSQVDKILNAA